MICLYRTLQCSIVSFNLLAVVVCFNSFLPKPIVDLEVDNVVADITENSPEMEKTVSVPLPFQLSEDPNDVRFFLYPDPRNLNASQELIFNDTKSVDRSKYNSKEMTVFLIHGFWSNRTTRMPTTLKKGFLEAGLTHNIIVVDWGPLSTPNPAKDIHSGLSYPIIVKRNIPIVYKRVADFIQFLIDCNFTTLDKLHVIGHSLGAHVSGGVGRTIANNSKNGGRKLERITGLDPAGPLFQAVRVQRSISPKDAKFVDVYHTAAGTLGSIERQQGHADFFPNGGHNQPGCLDVESPLFLEADFGSCSHSFVVDIYAASITRKFPACKCDPMFLDFVVGNMCPGNCTVSVLAGEPCPPSSRGQFYFETSEDPYSD